MFIRDAAAVCAVAIAAAVASSGAGANSSRRVTAVIDLCGFSRSSLQCD
jgi:hypothetical protein